MDALKGASVVVVKEIRPELWWGREVKWGVVLMFGMFCGALLCGALIVGALAVWLHWENREESY